MMYMWLCFATTHIALDVTVMLTAMGARPALLTAAAAEATEGAGPTGDDDVGSFYSDEQLHAALGAWVDHPDHMDWRTAEYMFQARCSTCPLTVAVHVA